MYVCTYSMLFLWDVIATVPSGVPFMSKYDQISSLSLGSDHGQFNQDTFTIQAGSLGKSGSHGDVTRFGRNMVVMFKRRF